ncbi:hypothetical protein WA158_000195 [Blastocystis sp. Blastoise]
MKFVLAICLIAVVFAFDNGLGLKPQMGFNTWNKFGCNINEQLARDTADVMIEKGLLEAGYEYLNLDDCWQVSRDSNKKIVEDPKAFPSGMKALADYVHSKGLKFGLYSDAGLTTCAGRPGSLNYEEIDANTYAEWGVDYLKYDNCNDAGIIPEHRYPIMAEAFKKANRTMFLSMCEWGVNKPAEWARLTGNSWRTTYDITDSWNSMIQLAEENEPLWRAAGPGGWNDPDMLEVGNGGMWKEEYITHFSLWALMKAPLLIGCDLTKATDETFEILLNKEIIAINQDALGVQGHRVWSDKGGNTEVNGDIPKGNYEVWSVPLIDGSYAVILFNRNDAFESHDITAIFTDCGMRENTSAYVRDLWKHEDLGIFDKEFTASVYRHSVVVLKVTPKLM